MSASSASATSHSLQNLLHIQEEVSSNAYGISLPLGGFERRISYLCGALGSIVDSIVSFANLIFSLFDAALCLFKDPERNGICRHYFARVDLALSSIYIGLVGTLTPHAADALAGNFFKQIKCSISKIRSDNRDFHSLSSRGLLAQGQLDQIDRFAEK